MNEQHVNQPRVQNVIEPLPPVMTPLHKGDVVNIYHQIQFNFAYRAYNMFNISYKYVI